MALLGAATGCNTKAVGALTFIRLSDEGRCKADYFCNILDRYPDNIAIPNFQYTTFSFKRVPQLQISQILFEKKFIILINSIFRYQLIRIRIHI